MSRLGLVSLAILLGAAIACGGGNGTSAATPVPSSTPVPSPTPLVIPEDNRIRIPAIGVDAPLTYRQVPRNTQFSEKQDNVKLDNAEGPDDVALYDFALWTSAGGVPGIGKLVLAGNLDSGSKPCKQGTVPPPCKAVFWDLMRVKQGDDIQVFWNRQAFVFKAVARCFIPVGDFGDANFERIWGRTEKETVMLITAGGNFDRTIGYTHRVVVLGEKAEGTLATTCDTGSASAPPRFTPTPGP